MQRNSRIIQISPDEAFDIVRNPKYSQRGLFLVNCMKMDPPYWIALDNTEGMAVAEKFSFRESAEAWLRGEDQ